MTPFISALAAFRASEAASQTPSYIQLQDGAALAVINDELVDSEGTVILPELVVPMTENGKIEYCIFSQVSSAEALTAVIRRLLDGPADKAELATLSGRTERHVLKWLYEALPAGGWTVARISVPIPRGRPRTKYQLRWPKKSQRYRDLAGL